MVSQAPETADEKEAAKKRYELSTAECQLAQERMEHMKQWESQKPVNVASGIVIEDNKKVLKLGPRSIKQLTEDQQLKLALAKSVMLDDDEDEFSIEDLDSVDKECPYLEKEVVQNLKLRDFKHVQAYLDRIVQMGSLRFKV